ncbi:GNAT family N-acetyltransferase [Streptomyces sp. NPDC127038]|uniref:GNAT family N-acetyltransferase n=1 Tax=Streptomyces sp. NPDC127038 TaxID=3347114 RepID=UPI00366A3BED
MSPSSSERVPAGYRSRPATAADVTAVHRLVAACEYELHGRVSTGPDRVAADLAPPGPDTKSDTLLVHDSTGELAAWGRVKGRRSTVHVHPRHTGRRLGSWLLAWAEERARWQGSDRLAQTVADNHHAAIALLGARGYSPLVTEWLLGIATPAEPEVPEPPAGIIVRSFRAGDARAAYRLTEDAFDEWQQRRKTYAEWAEYTVRRATFEPAASPVAFRGDEMVGAVLSLDLPDEGEGHIERVAVRRDQRNRGLARMLLREAFRAFHEQGKQGCTLWTHSDTGALALYERIGMTVRRSSTVYSRKLATG